MELEAPDANSSISFLASRTPSLPLWGSMLTKGISTSEFCAAISSIS
jgi:hypothetical protein